MVEKQIKLLLHDHDCVVIPEFGGLIARYVSARIHPVKHTLVPPSKRIAFNEKLILNDGVLISAIAHSKGISQQEAQQQVAAFVFHAREKLKTENRFQLKDIGIFRYNAADRLEFEFVESENLLDGSFGLPELVARPVRAEESAVLRTLIKERQPQVVATKQPLRKRLKRAYNVTAALLVGGVAVTGFYLLSLQTDYNLSSLNPISQFGIGNNVSVNKTYSRYMADYVPLTAEERASAYQEALPLTVAAQPEVASWQSFASSLSPDGAGEAEVTDNDGYSFDGWDETVALAGMAEDADNKDVVSLGDAPEATAAAPVAMAETKLKEHTIKGKDGRSYVITGGYSTLDNAEESRVQMQKKGYEPLILLPGPGSRLYRVAVAGFATESEAHEVKREYRKIFGETIWVLKN